VFKDMASSSVKSVCCYGHHKAAYWPRRHK
jgi:hypothetical protein